MSPEALKVKPDAAADAKEYGVTDEQSGEYLGPHAGATACVAVVRDDQLYVASVGDSRCVLSDNGKAVGLTRDHKAHDEEEARRVVQVGHEQMDGRLSQLQGGSGAQNADVVYVQAIVIMTVTVTVDRLHDKQACQAVC